MEEKRRQEEEELLQQERDEEEKEEKRRQEEETLLLNSTPAETNLYDLKRWWNDRGDGDVILQAQHVRQALFKKVKHEVPEDLWIAGAAQPGVPQHVTAVVSEEFALKQLHDCIMT